MIYPSKKTSSFFELTPYPPLLLREGEQEGVSFFERGAKKAQMLVNHPAEGGRGVVDELNGLLFYESK
jgi:hypothetical protein